MRIRVSWLPAAAICLLHAGAPLADEWSLDRSIAAKTSYNDNLNLQASNPVAAASIAVTPQMVLSNRTESREASATFAATGNRYLEHREFNTVDYRALFAWNSVMERDQYSLSLGSVRDSTLSSELQTTGVALTRRQRTLTNASATWQHSLSERTSANVAATTALVRYETGPGLVDYDDHRVSTGMRYLLTERASLRAAIARRQFETTAGDVKSIINSASIGGQYQYSERLVFELDAGQDRTRTDLKISALTCPSATLFATGGFCITSLFPVIFVPVQTVIVPVSSNATGATYNGSASYQFENGALSSSIGRTLNASGSGSLLRSEQASINYLHKQSERLEMGFGASFVRSGSVGSTTSDTRYTSISPSVTWKADALTTVSAGYTHSTQRSSGQPQAAESNLFFVSVSFGFRPLTASR